MRNNMKGATVGMKRKTSIAMLIIITLFAMSACSYFDKPSNSECDASYSSFVPLCEKEWENWGKKSGLVVKITFTAEARKKYKSKYVNACTASSSKLWSPYIGTININSDEIIKHCESLKKIAFEQ